MNLQNRRTRLKPLLRTALAALAATTFLGACNRGGTSGGGDTVAVVNGEKISTDDYNRYMSQLAQVRVATGQGVVAAPVAGGTIGFQALEDVIRRQALMQLAKDEGVYPTDADVEAELKFQIARNPNFLQAATKEKGLSMDAIKNELRVQVAQEKLITKGITVSDDQVDRYIKANPDKFTEPKRVSLLWISVKDPAKKKQVDDALAGSTPFGKVAEQFSEAPNARAVGGHFNPQGQVVDVYNAFSPGLKKLVDDTGENRASDWVKDPGGAWLKFYVERKTEARKIDITPVIKETVKRAMATERGKKGSDLDRKLQAKILGAKVDIPNKALGDVWKTAVDAAKANDPTGTAANAAAPAATPASGN